MLNFAHDDGVKEGRKEGIEEGIEEGISQGRKYNVPISVDTIRRRKNFHC